MILENQNWKDILQISLEKEDQQLPLQKMIQKMIGDAITELQNTGIKIMDLVKEEKRIKLAIESTKYTPTDYSTQRNITLEMVDLKLKYRELEFLFVE